MTNEYAAGLREIADLLDAVPDLPTPNIDSDSVTFHLWTDADKEVARFAKAIGGRWHKNDPKANEFEAKYYVLTHDHAFGPYKLRLLAQREAVCNRIQVGTRTVKEEARAASVKEVPVYEWECVPLLKKVDELASAPEAISA